MSPAGDTAGPRLRTDRAAGAPPAGARPGGARTEPGGGGDRVEPVRVPGEIQPYGFLLGVDPVTSRVELVSENLGRFLDISPADALGRSTAELLGAAVAGRLPMSVPDAPAGTGERQPQVVRLPPRRLARDRTGTSTGPDGPETAARAVWDEFELVAHQSGRLRILEFEPSAVAETGLRSLHDSFTHTLDHLRSVDSIGALAAAAADEVRALTGYDRVIVYRFDPGPDRHGGDQSRGEVVAESRRSGVASFLGLGFPAQSVGTSSQDLYLRSWARLVADVDDEPVGLLGLPGAAAAVELDPTVSSLRNAFPMETASLRLLGISALMSMPVIIDGRLWGLLACHHETPRRVSHQVRDSCEMVTRVLSLQLRAAKARIAQEQTAVLGGFVAEVMAAMALAGLSLETGAVAVPEALLGMVAADGVVLQLEGRRVTAGFVPPAGDIDALVRRVADLAGDARPPWTTDRLPAVDAAARGVALPAEPSATGVLYLPFGGRHHGYALWLRGEEIRRRTWARAAHVPPAAAPSASPGFAVGDDELVRGTSRPWTVPERAAADSFARALPGLLLNRAQRVLIEQELAAGAERLTAAEDRGRLEHQLQQHQRMESLGQLAGGVAHDFNNLLAVILNYAEFVGDEVDTEAREAGGDRWHAVQEDVEQIKAATGRAADLTRQLLAFARREVVRPRPLNLNHVVRGLEHLLRRTIGERVELRTVLADHLDLILADPGQVEQILVNLAVNARDAMPGGGTLTIETADVDVTEGPGGAVTMPGTPPERYVRLRVRDTGTGIPPEIIDRVFEPFFTTKATGDGTGLGVATIHGIVRQVGGIIEIGSEPGRGTVFTMVFPATDLLPAAVDRPAEARTGVGGETVLVVEDGDDLREVTRRLLARAGYQVLTASNGYEAIEAARRHRGPVHLLLTDMIMPFMTGDQVASRIRETHPEVRVLFMSGYAQPVLAAGGSLTPDHPLLDKPFTRSALLIKVLEVLDQPVLLARG